MRGFLSTVTQFAAIAKPQRLLEVGCGEGKLVAHLHARLPSLESCEACDVSLDKLAAGLPAAIAFRVGSAYELPYEDASFDLVVCCEVLEHLEKPELAIAELCRVSSRYVLVSTPREPLWRVLNLLRFAYLPHLGNTPGHLQHFSVKRLKNLLGAHVEVRETDLPIPWIVMLTERRATR
jgi:ubiquinone/menaquinone biosynthesis C-methylase UbiE